MLKIPEKRRGKQKEYNHILDEYNPRHIHSWKQNLDHLMSLGYAYNEAKNAIQVWSTERRIRPRLTKDTIFKLLDDFDCEHKPAKDCVKHLMRNFGVGYRRAQGHVYRYRK